MTSRCFKVWFAILLTSCLLLMVAPHKRSLVDPDSDPLVYIRGIRSSKSNQLLENFDHIKLLLYKDENFSLFSSGASIIQANFTEGTIREIMKLSGVKPYGLSTYSDTQDIFLCLTSKSNSIDAPLYFYTNSSIQKYSKENWPSNYCSSSFEKDFLVISGSRMQSTITTLETWKGGSSVRIRQFSRASELPKLYYYKDSKVLALLGGFKRSNIAYFVSRERKLGMSETDARAYVNLVSKICPVNVTGKSEHTRPLRIQSTEIKCVFTQENVAGTFEFGRLVHMEYEAATGKIFGLFNTWESGHAASALCLIDLDESNFQKCENEVNVAKNKPIGSKTKNPIFMETRQTYFLTQFSMERISERFPHNLFYFASHSGVIIKAIINLSNYKVTVLSKTTSMQQSTKINQLEIIGEQLFLASDRDSSLLPKHQCVFYSCKNCEEDPFCFWSNTTKICGSKSPLEIDLEHWEESLGNFENKTELCQTYEKSGKIMGSNPRLLDSKLLYLPVSETTTNESEAFENSSFLIKQEQLNVSDVFEMLLADVYGDQKLVREALKFGVPSLILGIAFGALTTYAYACYKSEQLERARQDLYENRYPPSNYRAPSEANNTSNMTKKNSKTYPAVVDVILSSDAQQTFVPDMNHPSVSSDRVLIYSEQPVASSPLHPVNPDYAYIPSDNVEISEPGRLVAGSSANHVAPKVPYVKCALLVNGFRKERGLSENSALRRLSTQAESFQMQPLVDSPSGRSLYTFSTSPVKRPGGNSRKMSQSSSISSVSDNVFSKT